MRRYTAIMGLHRPARGWLTDTDRQECSPIPLSSSRFRQGVGNAENRAHGVGVSIERAEFVDPGANLAQIFVRFP